MKYYIDGVVIVEGTNDESYLSSFIEAMYICTNGYEIPKEELLFIKECAKTKPIIILTDSDQAGEIIREKLNKELQDANNPKVDIAKCGHKGKYGVKECAKEEIIRVLQGFFENKSCQNNEKPIFLGFGEEAKIKRNLICEKYNLGNCNNKKMNKRLNFLGIKEEQIWETIKNGN